jgi:hypothetical protein
MPAAQTIIHLFVHYVRQRMFADLSVRQEGCLNSAALVFAECSTAQAR